MLAANAHVRIQQIIDTFDLVRAADIARRCGVTRQTVSRWQSTIDARARRQRTVLPTPHLRLAGDQWWSWPLLHRRDPDRFPLEETGL